MTKKMEDSMANGGMIARSGRRTGRLFIVWCVLVSWTMPVFAAIPASERTVLLDLFSQTGGAQWTSNTGWGGDSGTECSWFGVTCSADGAHVISLSLPANHLVGTLPPLAALTELETAWFRGPDYPETDQGLLTGSIPALSSLKKLTYFSVYNNKLTGAVPSLAGLGNLKEFDAGYNRLSGNIGSLSGLNELRYFYVQFNQLTGAIPDLAQTPKLNEFVAAHNYLSGTIPALAQLATLDTFNVQDNRLEGPIPAIAGLGWLYWFDVSHNRLTGTIPDLSGLVQLRGFYVGFNLLSGDVPAVVPPKLVSSGPGSPAASLCPNLLKHADSAAWNNVSSTPWYRDCLDAKVSLNQFGLTGAWYNPATSGQGLFLNGFPDLFGAGQGLLGAGWFTFDRYSTQPSQQQWYSLQGGVDTRFPYAQLDIYKAQGGNFAAPPRVAATKVGTALLALSDCGHATLNYAFDGSMPKATGSIPLTRIGQNSSCSPSGDIPLTSTNALLSGSWYDPAMSGQGILLMVDPSINVLAAAWYTYAKNGSQLQPSVSQRWFTLQTGSFLPGMRSINDVEILTSTDGLFDDPKPVTTQRHIGSADIAFQDCSHLTLTYRFAVGENTGASDTLHLVRLGPTPPGCAL